MNYRSKVINGSIPLPEGCSIENGTDVMIIPMHSDSKGDSMIENAGWLSPEDARQINDVIEEAFEEIDYNEWK